MYKIIITETNSPLLLLNFPDVVKKIVIDDINYHQLKIYYV